MTSATISKLKASLSELLTKVKAGEELIITDRGKMIAKIIPIKRDGLNIAIHLYDLEKSGLFRIRKKKLPDNFWDLPRPVMKTSAVNALIKDREEGR